MTGACTTTPTHEYTDTPILETIEAPTASNTQTALPILTATSTPIYFAQQRAEAHRIIFTQVTENEQTIFQVEMGSGDPKPSYTFPPEISLHEQPEVFIGEGEDTVSISFEKGLTRPWLIHLSPDGETLATIQPAYGGYPNYLHQIDLNSGDVISIKLFENYQWAIPIVNDRHPTFDGYSSGYEGYLNVLDMLQILRWSPNSSGFVFTIGIPSVTIGDTIEPDPGQIYYVSRGSDQVIPLASKAAGVDIGFGASWSPDSRYIAYTRTLSDNGIWLIEMANSETATQFTPLDTYISWSVDGQTIFYRGHEEGEEKLFAFDLSSTNVVTIAQSKDEVDDNVLYELIGQTEAGRFIVYEKHKVNDDYDPTRSRLINIDLSFGAVDPILEGVDISTFILSPAGDKLLFKYRDIEAGAILDVLTGEILFGPSEILYGLSTWSPDGHLIAGHSGENIIIWDLDSGESTIVASDFEGKKIFLGWVP